MAELQSIQAVIIKLQKVCRTFVELQTFYSRFQLKTGLPAKPTTLFLNHTIFSKFSFMLQINDYSQPYVLLTVFYSAFSRTSSTKVYGMYVLPPSEDT